MYSNDMAFQRPFLISLKKGDPRQQWGFRIFGGKDYGESHVIQSVTEDSVAERCGLRDGDEVIQVGRVNIQDLTNGQVQELLARCGNKIEMFVVRDDLLAPRKGKEPPVVKAVVHNPYNSPLQLYSTENIADTLARQTEVLTEGIVSTDEDEGPENLSFKQKSAVFQLLEEQSKQESPPETTFVRNTQQSTAVRKPKAPPPPPPKPKPPSDEHLFNGEEYTITQRYTSPAQIHQSSTERVVSQYQYQEPVKQTRVHQVTIQTSTQQPQGHQALTQSNYQHQQSYQSNYQQPQVYQALNQSDYRQVRGPQSPSRGFQSPTSNYQQSQGYQSPTSNYQQSQGYQSPTRNYQQPQSYQSTASVYQQPQGHQSPTVVTQPSQGHQSPQYQKQPRTYYPSQPQETSHQQQKSTKAVSNAEFKIGPPPPPRASSTQQQQQHNTDNMTAIYRQQYEQHLQQQQQQQQQQYYESQNNYQGYDDQNASRQKPTAHIITENIFENNAMSGTPITYKAPPAAPPKPAWPPASPQQNGQWRQNSAPPSPTGLKCNMTAAWPPKQPSARELPKTGFNPAAVREQGTGRRCVWPPQKSEDENRSGRNTPQSPVSGRRIQWNPSPSPPLSRRVPFASQSPSRRKDIAWPPPSPQNTNVPRDRPSPRLSRKAKFDDYIKEHASNNVPTTYRAPPGTQHVEFC